MMNEAYAKVGLFLLIIELTAFSEALLSFNRVAGLCLYAAWLLGLLLLLIQDIPGRQLFIALSCAPLMRIVSLVMPVPEGAVRIFTIFGVLLLLTMTYVYYLDIKRVAKAKDFMQFFWIFPVFAIILQRYMAGVQMQQLSMVHAISLIFASLVTVLFFNGLVQKLSEKELGLGGAFLSAVLIPIFQISTSHNPGFIMIAMLEAIVIALLYRANRSIVVSWLVLALLTLVQASFPLPL